MLNRGRWLACPGGEDVLAVWMVVQTPYDELEGGTFVRYGRVGCCDHPRADSQMRREVVVQSVVVE